MSTMPDMETINLLKTVPPNVVEVARLVKGYIVGGAVRDIVMNKKPKDYDIATPFYPDDVIKILQDNGLRAIPTGIDFGTITTILPDIGAVEITTFRSEIYSWEKGRKPDVKFGVTLEEDLSRRDFTINAMAIDSNTGELIDPFEGQKDIEIGVIRFVGNPVERITEDPLRMVRACRFSSRMGFNLGTRSELAISENAGQLKRIADERVTEEMIKASDNMSGFIDCMSDTELSTELFGNVIEDMKKHKHDTRGMHYGENVYEHTMDVMKCLDKKKKNDPALKLAGLFHDTGKPSTKVISDDKIQFIGHEEKSTELCKQNLGKLKGFPRNDIKKACWLVEEHMVLPTLLGSERSMARTAIDYRIRGIPREWLRDLVDFMECDTKQNLEPIYEALVKVYDTERPSGEKFAHIAPASRSEAIRSVWIQTAIEKLKNGKW